MPSSSRSKRGASPKKLRSSPSYWSASVSGCSWPLGNRHVVEQAQRHCRPVRARVVQRHLALVADEHVPARPVDAIGVRVPGQQPVGGLRRRAAGQRDGEAVPASPRGLHDPVGRRPGDGVAVRQHARASRKRRQRLLERPLGAHVVELRRHQPHRARRIGSSTTCSASPGPVATPCSLRRRRRTMNTSSPQCSSTLFRRLVRAARSRPTWRPSRDAQPAGQQPRLVAPAPAPRRPSRCSSAAAGRARRTAPRWPRARAPSRRQARSATPGGTATTAVERRPGRPRSTVDDQPGGASTASSRSSRSSLGDRRPATTGTPAGRAPAATRRRWAAHRRSPVITIRSVQTSLPAPAPACARHVGQRAAVSGLDHDRPQRAGCRPRLSSTSSVSSTSAAVGARARPD